MPAEDRNRAAERFPNSPTTCRSGNPAGRLPGTKNRATKAAEALLDGEAQALTRKAIDLALAGDTTALRLCLERIVPARKSRTLKFEMPSMERAEDLPAAMGAILDGVGDGSNWKNDGYCFLFGKAKHDLEAVSNDMFGMRPAES
jgi:hypothetical protein